MQAGSAGAADETKDRSANEDRRSLLLAAAERRATLSYASGAVSAPMLLDTAPPVTLPGAVAAATAAFPAVDAETGLTNGVPTVAAVGNTTATTHASVGISADSRTSNNISTSASNSTSASTISASSERIFVALDSLTRAAFAGLRPEERREMEER